MGQLPELMTVAEVAAVLRVTDETVHRWTREGRLRAAFTIGRKRYRRSYIESLVQEDLDQPSEAVS